ncbi:MAG: SDR family oxidoreductase [Rhodopseudomonas sp.]|uniref:SDR family NAD(P)-dependent oxidoreductase n=1 Tax=Rhodopseudomonas sp. TaxID=1078 RepID=UPI0017E3879B|nr:SDR family NAD(P)-dependent oxidoreductase [Rhodopseudomonas sp.]NVN85491.1 SDR family oxidoreductase [Rhodopseudomonas sp.]
MSAALHAFVTGAGSGIGRAVALMLASTGARISLAGRRSAPLTSVRDEVQAAGGEGFVLDDFDVGDPDSVRNGVARSIEQGGEISILVNCAGQAPSAPFEKTDLALWSRVMTTNLTGTFLVTQAVLPSMRRQPFGRVVNIASTAGLTGYSYVSAYCASKHGVIGLTRALALELAKTAITVNAVCPGFTETPLIDAAVATIARKTGRSADDARAELAQANPQGRMVQPTEVAEAVRWLISPGAAAVTGQAIAIDGGETMKG